MQENFSTKSLKTQYEMFTPITSPTPYPYPNPTISDYGRC